MMTEQQFQEWIDTARSRADEPGLWERLCSISGLEVHEVSQRLLDWHAIKAFPDDLAVPQIKVIKSDDCAVLVELNDHVYLLVEDPWSNEAMRRMEMIGAMGASFAMASQKVWERLAKSGPAGRQTAVQASKSAGREYGVVGFVDSAIARAYDEGASDIHFESSRAGMKVKYRLDGVMVNGEVLEDPGKSEEVISRIKVLGQLDITERRRPQDGRIRWVNTHGDGLDLRVSIMPSIFGEDAVLRLLDKAQLRHEADTISLDMLGFQPSLATQVRSLAARPHGMLLVTGPTGSGKTTTVYAALSEVNDGLEKIVTIEDPVEYELPGVLQIPVNEQKGLTFATGLRSILRHDPDKILVGEIRDAETAQIAVQSALTGHLVFTTVHANSLLDVLGRFRHFGIEPFALASALNGVVVQRLLRRCCPHCTARRALTIDEVRRLEAEALPVLESVPAPKGCDQCRGTGYRGRFVLAEVHTLTDAVRDLMLSQESMSAFKTVLYGDGKQRLSYQAMDVIHNGQTTMEEVRRVVGLG